MPRRHHEPLSEDEKSPRGSRSYNIYLNDNDIDTIKKEPTEARQSNLHMMIVHDKLRRDYDELKNELNKLRASFDEVENDSDRTEKDLINIKGVLQNVNASCRCNSKLVRQYVRYQKDTEKELIAAYKLVRQVLSAVMSALIGVMSMIVILYWFDFIAGDTAGFNIVSIMPLLITLTYFNPVSYWSIGHARKPLDITKTPYANVREPHMMAIRGLTHELDEITKGIDFLSDLL